MKNLLTKPIGTFCKALLATILTQYLIELQQGTTLFSMDILMVQKLLTAGLVANLPVLINWLNPSYQAYGPNK